MSADRANKLKRGCLIAGWLLWACWAVGPSGCGWLASGDYVKNISSAKPDVATQAMNKAAQEKSREAIVPLVGRLYDEDSVIRLSAITALESITGEDMGYRSYDGEVQRIAAIKRWKAWLIEEGLSSGQEDFVEEKD